MRSRDRQSLIPDSAPSFVRSTTAEIIAGREDLLPVALPADGTFPVGTTKFEKRNIASEIPVWETDICIQCGKCVLVCPHSVIRAKLADSAALGGAPQTLKSMQAKWREFGEKRYVLQVAAEDCTGCALCVEVCPAKDKSNVSRKALNMAEQIPLREQEARNWDFFLTLPEVRHTDGVRFNNIKNIQLLQPLFEFSGACSGCGETPYLKLLSQLSEIEPSSQMPPGAQAYMAVIFRPLPGLPTLRAAVPPGAIRSLKITPSSVLACDSRLTCVKTMRVDE